MKYKHDEYQNYSREVISLENSLFGDESRFFDPENNRRLLKKAEKRRLDTVTPAERIINFE